MPSLHNLQVQAPHRCDHGCENQGSIKIARLCTLPGGPAGVPWHLRWVVMVLVGLVSNGYMFPWHVFIPCLFENAFPWSFLDGALGKFQWLLQTGESLKEDSHTSMILKCLDKFSPRMRTHTDGSTNGSCWTNGFLRDSERQTWGERGWWFWTCFLFFLSYPVITTAWLLNLYSL